MELKHCIGLGIAGNFAKHLEQAGEMKDFLAIKSEEGAPKGIFPFYLPKSQCFLNQFPISNDQQVVPDNENPQVEPELALYCELSYDECGQVMGISPLKFTAFNDCTIRKDGATKISEKKNWGANSKGASSDWIDIDVFSSGGIMDAYNLASFVKRDGMLHPYGIDTEVRGYSYFYEQLIQWLIDQMNTQQDVGPLENISQILQENDYPSHAIILVGATAYESFGENNYLKHGDEITVVVYPNSEKDIQSAVETGVYPEGTSVLIQRVLSFSN